MLANCATFEKEKLPDGDDPCELRPSGFAEGGLVLNGIIDLCHEILKGGGQVLLLFHQLKNGFCFVIFFQVGEGSGLSQEETDIPIAGNLTQAIGKNEGFIRTSNG